MTEVAVSMPHNPSDRGFGTPGKGSHSAGRSSAPDNNTDPRSNSGRPIKVDNKKRKKIYEQNAMLQLSEVRLVKKKEIKLSKENARKILRKIPIELLARDWLNESQATVDIRAYMVDNVFPTLILGVEKLLTEVDSRQLASDEINGGYGPNFNPVNYLAQYLMRNNPRYSNFSEASPYVRGLRQIAEELKAELFDMEDNRLARIKKEAKHKREGRELQAQLKQQETERRQKVFMTKFAEWNVTTDNNQVELSLLQNTLRSFVEVTEQFPAEVQDAAKYGHPLEPTDETGRTLSLDEFAQYLSFYVENLPSDVFEEFMVHMAKCAMAYRAAADREYRRIALTNLFIQCDHSGIGQLDRHRILNLFEQIWDTYKDSKRFFRNPRKWPVVEVDEADDSFSDEEDDVPALLETMAPAQSLEITPADISGSQESSYALNSQGESSQYLHETSLNLPNSSQSLPKSSENLPNSSQNLPNSSQNLTKSSQNLPNSLQNLPNSSQNLPNSSQNLPNSSQNLPKSSQNLPKSSQNLPNSSQNLPGASQNLPGASQNLPASTLSSEMFLLEAGTEYGGVTFAEGTSFERQRTNLTTASANRSQSQLSAFDESSLNVSQFVQLTENFLGENPIKAAFEKLVTFIREGYEETEDEKMERLMKAHKEAISASHKAQLDALFEKWDNDGCGYLDLTDVEEVMLKYKEGQEKNTIAKAQEELKSQSKFIDARLNKQEFRNFVTMVIEEMPGDSFEYFVEFLTNSVERSYAERVRGEARKKWLQMIINAAETSGISLESVYKAVFQALYRDAETHGSEKRISANIALLERNTLAPQRGDVMLRYTACTPEDANYVFQKILFRDMKGISFAAVDSGKPVHVPRVSTHGNIQFWNTDRTPEEREGSFIVVPLKDRKKRVFGVLGIDTLCNTHGKAIFITHEIQFFQGVAQTFSIAYHLIDMRRKLLRITESAISWIKRRAPQVTEIMVYMVEPGKSTDFVLRRMMTTDKKGFPVHIKDPPVRLERKDNLFRDYLFKCVDNSETVTADAYGNRHLAFPLRDNEGKAIALVDINIGHLRKLPAHENKETQRMLRLLQQAHREITQEFAGEDKMLVLDAEKDDDTRMEIMFDRLMLMELRENVSKLDSKAWAELRAYNSPPEIVLHILRASLSIFYPELTTDSEFDNWSKIRSYINGDLIQKVQAYDPTLSTDLTSSSVIEEYLKDVPHGEVTKHGSLPAQYLYNWVFVCLSLIDHTRKMRQNQDQELLPVTKPNQTAVAEVKSDTDIL